MQFSFSTNNDIIIVNQIGKLYSVIHFEKLVAGQINIELIIYLPHINYVSSAEFSGGITC